ncbi:hypothetical protein OG417_39610 [Actinoallomurus sp. NBC_01490]|uniref:hypothetical protein n=1 Tax=Actinoallomurus sp. NBC_01490 TaxID=2903557 RepID=UPI002E32B2F5|nr:hypothetical protein [Actinoallomurus sp. NBC_01490]
MVVWVRALSQLTRAFLRVVVGRGPPEELPEVTSTEMSAVLAPLAISASRRSVEWAAGIASRLEWVRCMGASSVPEAWVLMTESFQRFRQVVSFLSG